MSADARLASFCADLVRRLTADGLPLEFAVAFWNGEMVRPRAAPPRFTVTVRCPDVAREVFARPSIHTLANAYVRGDLDADADLLDVIAALARIAGARAGWRSRIRLLLARWVWPPAHGTGRNPREPAKSRGREREAIGKHYDLPVEFWRLWLDPQLLYTCAYYPEPGVSLADAQTAKLDRVCRKIGLRAGDHVLDLGCGWGAFACFAARRYGARVTAVTLSREQAGYVAGLISRERLQDTCEVRECDFRDLTAVATFDKAVGLGIFEHVGPALMGDYFATVFRCLRPGGLFLNQAIARSETDELILDGQFIDAHIFQDAELMPIGRALTGGERAGFDVTDVEFFQGHYDRTLRAWAENLDSAAAEVGKVAGAAVYRAFRLYLAIFRRQFALGTFKLYQSVFRKPAYPYTEPLVRGF